MEHKLKEYYDALTPEPGFHDRLLALEEESKPRLGRRRLALPIAAMLIIALAVGGGWRYLRKTLPQPLPESDAQAVEPAVAELEPASAAEPAPAEPKRPAPVPEGPAQSEPEPIPEDGPPQIAGAAQEARPAAGARTEQTPPAAPPKNEPAPEQAPPPDEKPGSLGEDRPEADPPEVEPPAQTPDPPEQTPDPPIVDPPEENPDPPDVMITLSADFFSEGEQDFVSVTNDATGETVTYDMTGLVPTRSEPGAAAEDAESYSFQRGAFGCDFALTITREADGSAEASATPIP